jgi:hypothetical protein
MAKAATKAPKAKKSVKKAVKAVAKAAPKSKRKTVKKVANNAADALWKLADNPLIGEMLAIGAGAAVAALAESGIAGKGKNKKISSKAIKGAGKAAAAAIGARLVSEFTGLAKPSRAKQAKPAKPAKPATRAKA